MKTPSKKSVLETAALIGGGVGGGMVSRGAFGWIHEEKVVEGTDWAKLGKRSILIGVGTLGAVFLPSTGLSALGKGACIGMAVTQALDAIADVSATSTTTAALATGSKSERIFAKALGLKCPCEQGLQRPRRSGRGRNSLRMPIEIPAGLVDQSSGMNSLEAKFYAAQQKAA